MLLTELVLSLIQLCIVRFKKGQEDGLLQVGEVWNHGKELHPDNLVLLEEVHIKEVVALVLDDLRDDPHDLEASSGPAIGVLEVDIGLGLGGNDDAILCNGCGL